MPWTWYFIIAFWSEASFFLRPKRWASFTTWFIVWHVCIIKGYFILLICLFWIEPLCCGSKCFIFVFLQLIFHLFFCKIKTRRRTLSFISLVLSNLRNLTRLGTKYNSIEERFHRFRCKPWCQFFILAIQRLSKVVFVGPNLSITF